MKQSSIVRLFGVLCVFALVFGLAPCALADEAGALPTLHLDYIPPYGVAGEIEGIVYNASGDLAVTGYLQVSEGGQIWGPKPTYTTPAVPVEADGSFSLYFITGGNDIQAVVLYVLLVPANAVPDEYDAAESVALDKLVITRTADGAVTILPREGKWVRPETTPTPLPIPTATPLPTPTVVPFANPYAGEATIAINYSPYTDGQNPDLGSSIPLAQMSRHLDALRPYVDTIRTFGVTGELAKLYPMAKEQYGYRIIAGCWLGAGYSDEQVKAELDALIAVANQGWCDVAVVGSECLYRGDYTAAQMVSYIEYVRKGITNKAIPVTTSDTAAALLANRAVGKASDVVMATYYPFFEGVPVEDAAQDLLKMYGRLLAAYPGKKVIISETGWPSDGSAEGAAVPSAENAAYYFGQVYDWSETEGIEVVFFSALDEGWKVEGANDDIGTHWGHFTAEGALKPAYRDQGIYAIAARDGATAATGPSVEESMAAIYRMLGRGK